MQKPDYVPCDQPVQCKGGSTSDCAWKEPMRMPRKDICTTYGYRGKPREQNYLGGSVIDLYHWS